MKSFDNYKEDILDGFHYDSCRNYHSSYCNLADFALFGINLQGCKH